MLKLTYQVSFPYMYVATLQWLHNGRDGVWNHQPHHCLFNRLFRCKSKKTSKLRVTGLCEGNSPVTGEFPAQRASNAENVSIWWRHHEPSMVISVPADVPTINVTAPSASVLMIADNISWGTMKNTYDLYNVSTIGWRRQLKSFPVESNTELKYQNSIIIW